eukprot:scaffold176089_cov28-Tisochrysis_lutea.AAC.4
MAHSQRGRGDPRELPWQGSIKTSACMSPSRHLSPSRAQCIQPCLAEPAPHPPLGPRPWAARRSRERARHCELPSSGQKAFRPRPTSRGHAGVGNA